MDFQCVQTGFWTIAEEPERWRRRECSFSIQPAKAATKIRRDPSPSAARSVGEPWLWTRPTSRTRHFPGRRIAVRPCRTSSHSTSPVHVACDAILTTPFPMSATLCPRFILVPLFPLFPLPTRCGWEQ